jgi:hypothetical protein
MNYYYQEKPLNPGWSLGDIPDIRRGRIPDALLPQSPADWMAIAFLKRESEPPLSAELVDAGAMRLRASLPYNQLCEMLVWLAHPFIVREWPASVELFQTQRTGLYRFLQRIFRSSDSMHEVITRRQLELVQNWPVEGLGAPADGDLIRWDSDDLIRWDALMLAVALMEQVYFFVKEISPQNLSDRAIGFVTGETPQPDWYLAGQASLATVRGNLELMEVFRKGAKLPARAKQSHITGGNPADRDMRYALGEALTECDVSGARRRWEAADDPWAYLRTTAMRKGGKPQIEDDAEGIAAREAGFELVRDLDGQPAEKAGPLSANTIPQVEDLPQALLADLAEVRDPEAVRRVYEARRQGTPWDAISESDRMKWRRAEPALRKAIAREAVWRALPDATLSAAGASVYKERFPRVDGVYQTWSHLFDSPEKLSALKAVLAGERLPVTERPQGDAGA